MNINTLEKISNVLTFMFISVYFCKVFDTNLILVILGLLLFIAEVMRLSEANILWHIEKLNLSKKD